MRMVAATTPQLAVAAARAFALRKFLDLRNGTLLRVRLAEEIRDQGLFERLAGAVIVQGLTGIENSRFAFEVALLADAVASRAGECGGIDDVPGRWPPRVRRAIAVAALAGDRLHAASIAGDVQTPAVRIVELNSARVTKEAVCRNGPVEIEQWQGFETR